MLNIAEASSRNKQLQRYKGNWATIEIMKTLLKNRRAYQSRIGSADQHIDHNSNKDIVEEELEDGGKEEEEAGRGKNDGNDDSDDWNDMYVGYGNGGEGDDENDGENGDGGEDEGGSCGIDVSEGRDDYDEVLGRNNDEGRNGEGSKQVGLKRKIIQDDEPATATRAKRMKLNPTQSTKKAAPKRKNSKK